MNEFWISLSQFEIPVLDFLRENVSCKFLDVIMPFVSAICNHGEIWIIWALILLFIPKYRKTGVSMAIALCMGLIIVNMIMKPAVARIRPFDLTGVYLIIDKPTDYSFPSGHTLSSFEAFGAMLFTHKKMAYIAVIPAVLIAFSRLYLYVHYPTDVIVSVILGLLFAFLSVKITEFIYKKKAK